ncbi:MBL fold metallo-hydrolase [Nocardioides sp.]|uniref:MBL fold metallo-hydrolase n=1 Tax=Nocardioides sp. TaxID=35761 RepID=UPI0039E3F25C
MTSGTSTAYAVSPDSGEPWATPGAWPVAEGIHRIPLPLPNDGLRAVNVYTIETEDGLTLVDGGWAITEGREALAAGLRQIGRRFTDIRHFLVTHAHRDHYTLARVLGREFDARVWLGRAERGALAAAREFRSIGADRALLVALRESGASELVERLSAEPFDGPDPETFADADDWIEGDVPLAVGERTLNAVHTPGHTQGHYVFADLGAGLLFAGDHVLPTITPSIGLEGVVSALPLGDFMASLAKVRAMPDLRLLPAHGPVAPSAHARVEELLAHHEHRLDQCSSLLGETPKMAYEVAQGLGWTRHERPFASLDLFNASLAAMETKAHLDLLAARGRATRTETPEGVTYVLVKDS